MGILNLRDTKDNTYNDNIRKKIIYPSCKNTKCPRYNDPCCQIGTEIVRTTDYEGIDILFIGQGAGKVEEKFKRPFIGPAGKYLRNMIVYLWSKEEPFNIALTNNVRCHPVDNNGKDRCPNKIELEHCLPIVLKEIEQINPRTIITLGKNATQSLIDTKETMGRIHGNLYKMTLGDKKFDIVPTYHPSYLLRQYRYFSALKPGVYDLKVLDDILMVF